MKTCWALFLLMVTAVATADDVKNTVSKFQGIDRIAYYFNTCYGYVVFPTVAKAGFGIGGAYGEGKVFERGIYIGNAELSQLSIGFQAGGQAFSEIIFFKDKPALNTFTQGKFEFGAQASAVALTVGASAHAGTTGVSAGVVNKQSKASYVNGMVIFTLAKGGLMYEASIGGQKFTFYKK